MCKKLSNKITKQESPIDGSDEYWYKLKDGTYVLINLEIKQDLQALEAEVKGLKEALQSVMETLEAGDIMGHESYYVNRIKELLTPAEAGKK